jgi:hypothetical protein
MIFPCKKRKVIISATCHGSVLQALLINSPSFVERYECEYIPNYQACKAGFERAPNTLLLSKLSECDVLIYHDTLGISHSSLVEYLPSYAATIVIPYPTSLIFWPAHSLDPIWLLKELWPGGIPYPCLHLNKLILSVRDRRRILEEYMHTDFSQCCDLDGIFKAQIEYLKRAQANSPLDVANFVVNNFAKSRLFHLPNHPALPLFEFMASGLLELLGCKPASSLSSDPFANHQTPVHPSIIKYYDLAWCSPSTTYHLLGRELGFEAYVQLYIDGFIQQSIKGMHAEGVVEQTVYGP